jgi:hypothetical protein
VARRQAQDRHTLIGGGLTQGPIIHHCERQMSRVYFETNEGVAEGYGLWLNASMKDLSCIPDGPQEACASSST